MMKKETIMKRRLKFPVELCCYHRYCDLPACVETWHTNKDSLSAALFDLSFDWGITEIYIGKTKSTIWLIHCVDFDGILHDTNIDADTIEHIIEAEEIEKSIFDDYLGMP